MTLAILSDYLLIVTKSLTIMLCFPIRMTEKSCFTRCLECVFWSLFVYHFWKENQYLF